jgi:predicted TIM-barrel fold metal-dependent hydrolase
MLIVDSQVHIWAASTKEQPWPPGRQAPHAPSFSQDQLLAAMDSAGVDRAVLVPPSWVGEYNGSVLEAAKLHPDRFAVMGRLALDAPDVREQIARWRDQPGMLGFRFTFFKPDETFREDWIWGVAEKARLPIMLLAQASHLAILDDVAAKHPDLRLAIDHMGVPGGKKDADAFAHLDKLCALAKRPNIAIKVSCLPFFTTDAYPYRALHPQVRRIYDAFGPHRMFWGSDLSRLPCSYREAVTAFTEEMPWLSAPDKELIMGRALCDWIGC